MEAGTQRPILIAYDGSETARAAVAEAGRLFAPLPAIVLTAWQSVERAAAVGVIGMPSNVAAEAVHRLDAAASERAGALAAEGADLAAGVGLDARPEARAAERNEWSAIVREADEADASVVVVGSRGRSGIGSAVLGSVSSGVVHHSGRPVLVVRRAEK